MKLTSNHLLAIYLAIFLAGFTMLGMYLPQPPKPEPVNAPPSEFSAERAFQHVLEIAQKPHPVGSIAHDQVRDYIIEQLQTLNLNPQIQNTVAINPNYGAIGEVQNIVAKLPGEGSGSAILLVAHYDSVDTSPGASDDSSAVATLIETIRALKHRSPLDNDIILLFSDGEEIGLLGASGFVADHPWAKDVGLVLNFESRGVTGPVYMFETSMGNAALIPEYAKATLSPLANSFIVDIYKRLPNDTDFTVFKGGGNLGLNFAIVAGGSRYHAMTDNLDNFDLRTLQDQGSDALSLAQHFGNIDLTTLHDDRDIVYFNVLNFGLIYYSTTWIPPLSAVTILLFILLVIKARQNEKVSLKGLALSTLAFLLNVLLVIGLAWLILQLLFKAFPQYVVYTNTHNAFFYWFAFLMLAVAQATTFYKLVRRQLNLATLIIGALFWWLIITVVLGQIMPGTSFALQWPLLFSLLGFYLLLPYQEYATLRSVAVMSLSSLPALLIFAPNIYNFYIALSFDLIVVSILCATLFLGLLIPHLDLLTRYFQWGFPIVASILAVLSLIIGNLAASPSAEYPQSDSILYALNADTGQALWVSEDQVPDMWTVQFLGDHYKKMSLPDLFPTSSYEFLTAPAPVLDFSVPVADVLTDELKGKTRLLRLRILPSDGSDYLSLSFLANTPIVAVTINDKRIIFEDHSVKSIHNEFVQRLAYWTPPANGFELTVEIESAETINLLIRNWYRGLPEIPGLNIGPRPPDRMPLPNSTTDNTVVSRMFIFSMNP